MVDCLLIGNETLLAQCGRVLQERGHQVVAVVADGAPARDWAGKAGVPGLDWGSDLAETLAHVEYDWLFSIANLRMLPEAVCRKARQGAANFHDGPLPRFAGLNAPVWAILEDERSFGVTWHEITAGADEGVIHAQSSFPIDANETALSLNTKCFEAGLATFGEMLGAIERGALAGAPQDLSQRTYYARDRRPPAAATLAFDRPAGELARLWRALDVGPGYANRLVAPKVLSADGLFHLTRLEAMQDMPQLAEPGTVLSVTADGALVAAADRPVLIEGVGYRDGALLSARLRVGERLPMLADSTALDAAVREAVRYEARAVACLQTLANVELYDVADVPGAAGDHAVLDLGLPASMRSEERIAAIAAFLARFSGQDRLDVAYSCERVRDRSVRFPDYFVQSVPLRIELAADAAVGDFARDVAGRLDRLRREGAYLGDLPRRGLGVPEPRLSVGILESGDDAIPPLAGCALTFVLGAPGGDRLVYDRARISDTVAAGYVRRVAILASAFAVGAGLVADLPLMSEEERRRLLVDWNDSARDHDRTLCVHAAIERQVDRTPDATAVAWRGESVTYRELDRRANRVAHALAALGVRPDTMVGLHLPRSIDLVIGAFAVQKAGGAYLPLDPDFPADRLAYMVEDSGADVILASRALAGTLPAPRARTVFIEDLLAEDAPESRPVCAVAPENLAYVIYTSGSTGRPKGVMVEHRNVVNFFAGMDERVAHDGTSQPVWLAVTSLSFDISVLELFWTLARGFKVVIHSAETRAHKGSAQAIRRSPGKGPMEFGLFYWGNDDGPGPAKYRLLLEGAKFADANGFQSVWTPERHFHAFGGPYPNPSVTGAAVAAVTKNLSIRAGSCVLPLHHPLRVAEEWAVIDNLSNGRVALAFASGWMPEDFVLRPENAPPHNKASMIRDIEVVRRLWRGEAVNFDFGGGETKVLTQPRPVQPELPVWLTTAGNPETYREAARMGANVLTHLLGQSIEELADKIRIYRETLAECGRNPDDYKVTLMLHTLLGENREEVRDLARGPMKSYLRSAAALIKQYAWAFPAFKKPQGAAGAMDIDLQTLSADELDAILEFAFQRYFEDSGLFGTVEDALARIDQIAAIGVDDVACLIDFGVAPQVVLDRLEPLARVVSAARAAPAAEEFDGGFAAEVERHAVTHLQCTPSMARMLLTGEADRAAFGGIAHLYIGGEALPGSLLADIRRAGGAGVENMYGPTETTIWSSTATVEATDTVAPLGRPIANTGLYVLDGAGRLAAPGQPGELHIGGEGVTRGYLNRPELTAERFIANPFGPGRLYRTGDLVRYTDDGVLRFLGRTDHQVKVRGYRIELGEIEARIASFEGVAEVVVVVREDREGDARIVAYLRLSGGAVCEEKLKAHLGETLPDYMIPAHFVTLSAFPLTPNAKIDRKALPKPEAGAAAAARQEYVAPESSLQRDIAEAYRRTLGLERVGVNDNFFALGGHSLLAVQLHRDLKAGVAPELAITDIFRFPTVAALADHLADRGKADERLSQVADRAALRRAALGDRRTAMARARN